MFEMYVKFVESSSKYELELRSVLCTITSTCFDPCPVYLTRCDRLNITRYVISLSIIFDSLSISSSELELKIKILERQIPLYI